MKATWGEETRFFFEMTPDRVMNAVEHSGLVCTGRCQTLNSFENRVYEVEVEVSDEELSRDPLSKKKVAKFYRPGRWSEKQILEEHEFIYDLLEREVPAIAPERFSDGRTLHVDQQTGIFYTVFPKVGGRAPDELSDEQLIRLGRLLARLHGVGSSKEARERMVLNPETYGLANLDFLIKGGFIPLELEKRYATAVERICSKVIPWFEAEPQIRLHGDCHLGNLLWNAQGPFFLDFDDMIRGPAVQDIWLLLPGRPGSDPEGSRQLSVLLSGYDEMREFNRQSLRLIEPLRALRMIHFSAWIARRWEDPAFPYAFPQFGTHRYWQEQLQDLEEQQRLIEQSERPAYPDFQ